MSVPFLSICKMSISKQKISKASPPRPTLSEEQRLWHAGRRAIAGIDEAGRGALAGPVVAAAVILPPGTTLTGIWAKVTDSKLLSAAVRSELEHEIQTAALAWAVGVIGAQQIDRDGIAVATRQAMMAAIDALTVAPDYLLIDWVRLAQVPITQDSFTKADQRIVSVAAASILAKVHRDRILTALEGEFPDYGFAQHKGYGTAMHLAAIKHHGPCAEHRHSFAPIAKQATLFD